MDVAGQNQDVFDLCSACVWIVKIRIITDENSDSDGYVDDNEGDSDGSFGDNEGDSDGVDDNEGGKNGNCDSDDSVDDTEEEGDYVTGSSDDNVDDEQGRNKRDRLICLTAFAVGRNGYLLTCAHGDWHANLDIIRIRAKRLGGDQTYTAKVVGYKQSRDMCLLKVDTKLDHVATWGTGDVNIGEPVFLIGHPSSLLGTLVVGAASYGCSKDVEFDFADDRRCRNFRYPGWIKPSYRIMGHLWNADTFQDMVPEERDKFRFEENYVARLPIIQCSNLAGGAGASGGPIFNMQGNVVGMLIGGIENYQIGVHVTALRQFVRIIKPLGKNLFKKRKQQQREELQERNCGQDIGADQEPVIPRYDPQYTGQDIGADQAPVKPRYDPEYSEQEMDAHQDPLYRG